MKVWLLGLATVGIAATAQSASAQTIYPYLKNNTGVPVTISEVSWTGSYFPRIEGTVQPNAEMGGSHRMANPQIARYTELSFKASFLEHDQTKRTCYFSYSFRSDTGTPSTSNAVRWTGRPVCTLSRRGNYIFNFEIGRDQ